MVNIMKEDERGAPRWSCYVTRVLTTKFERKTMREAKEKTGLSMLELRERYATVLSCCLDVLTKDFVIVVYPRGLPTEKGGD